MKKYIWKKFDKDVKLLVRRIKYAQFHPKTIIALATGGLPLGTSLKNKLKIPLIIISAKSYKGRQKGSLVFNVSFTKPPESPILVVDDIADTGSTIQEVYNYITSMGMEVKVATLFYKDRSKFKPDWYLNKTKNKDWIKFPWE